MPTFPRRSTRFLAVRIAEEATWGTDPASGGLELNPQDLALPPLEQASLPRNEAVRVGFLPPGALAGVKGGAGPSFKFDLCSALPLRASADTDAAPDAAMRALWGAVLGEGAGVGTDGYTAGSGRVCGGSTVASVTSPGGADQIATITVQSGDGANFSIGDAIVVFHGSVGYPMIVTGVSTDTLTVACGSHAANSGITSGDAVLGSWSIVGPVTESSAGINKSLTAEIQDSAGTIFRWLGCSGNATIEATAGGKIQATFDFMADSWPTPGSLSATLASGSTSWPQDARKRIAGVDTLVRIGAAGDGGSSFPNTLLQDYESYDGFTLDVGVTRADTADMSGSQGRSSRPVTIVEPKLTLRGYQIIARYGDFGAAGSLPTRRAVSIVSGDATNGGFFLVFPDAQLTQQPTHADKSGQVGQELVFAPYPHASGFPQFIIGFF